MQEPFREVTVEFNSCELYQREFAEILEREAEYCAQRECDGFRKEWRLLEDDLEMCVLGSFDESAAMCAAAENYAALWDEIVREALGLPHESIEFARFDCVYGVLTFNVAESAILEAYARSAADGHETLAQVIEVRRKADDVDSHRHSVDIERWLDKSWRDFDNYEIETLLHAALCLSDPSFEFDGSAGDLAEYIENTMLAGDGMQSEFDAGIDHEKLERLMADKRAQITTQWCADHDEPVPEDVYAPEPRCDKTLDLFRDTYPAQLGVAA